MHNLIDHLRPFIKALVAPILGAFFTWLAIRWNIVIDENTQAQVIFAVCAVIAGVLGVFINKVVNPGNMASKDLAVQSKIVTEHIKADQAIEKKEELIPPRPRPPFVDD